MFGFLNVNKPIGITSHDVIYALRKITKIKQIGHTGTLDPLACGVLPIAIGKASRLIEYLEEDKAYIAQIDFGKISDTYDTEGVVEFFSDKKIKKEDIAEKLSFFSGEIEQIPPAFSAVHYKGKRLYELARSGNIPDDIPKRKVVIDCAELIEFDEITQTAKIKIACSRGTYIRTIVNDLGMMLETGAVMSGLVRTKSGKFLLENSIRLEDLKSIEEVKSNLINPLDVLPFNCYNLTEVEYEKINHGQGLCANNPEGMTVLIYDSKIAAIALQSENQLKVKKVFGV